MPKALVIRTAGTNCDAEMCRGFELAGATVELVHLDRLIREPGTLDRADLVGFPGGFSYGDDIASGRIFAMKLREHLWAPLRDAAARGCPMLGICNGFQVMVQVGLLPGPGAGEPWPLDAAPAATVSLSDNAGGRFVGRWVGFELAEHSPCLWTRGILDTIPVEHRRAVACLPVAHGEGRVIGVGNLIADLAAAGRVPLTYTDNYNGSQRAAAGLCDATGRIFALMPHPDRYLDWNRHPSWTRLPESVRQGPTPGLRMFRNAVEAATLARA